MFVALHTPFHTGTFPERRGMSERSERSGIWECCCILSKGLIWSDGKGINKDSLPTSHLHDSPLAYSIYLRIR
jgi:hypothetical protein